ncbi:hypothetical protein [Algoriphagus confluentis]|uniref:ABC-2 family transporter protein n=1 Tax=Algoriphagus confluentis TaxID=1697556 RepID=A0ABQ6PRW5_9BACT|nr:hypothetical protein Aconfl_33460 [Algoriphagus confluentis]
MKQIIKFDLKLYFDSWFSLLAGALLFGAGLFSGLNFNFTVSEGVFLNSPYTIGVMTGFLSLSLLFLALVLGGKLLIREWDFSFAPLVFSTPLSLKKFLWGRFLSFLILVLSSFFVLYLGFGLGQYFRKGNEIQEGIFLLRYAYPFLVLGAFNGVLVCSFLFLLALSTKNKLHLVLGGLLLYIGYLIVLIFSNSPFMNSASPQAESTQLIAALIDPFGLSSYFYQSRDYTVGERNEVLVGFQGVFLINRLLVLVLSFGFIQTSFLLFTPGGRLKFSSRAQNKFKLLKEDYHSSLQTIPRPDFSLQGEFRSVYSYMKQDLVYAGKSIFLPVSVLLLLFYHGMEIYGQISGGLRIPERYASSGLVSQIILENFYLIGIFLFGFLANDMYWRSRTSGFWVLEDTTILSFTKHAGHLLAVVILILFYSGLLMLEGVFFQLAYGYPNFDWGAYGGILLFNTLPLLLFSVILILINRVFPSKYSALGVSLVTGIVLGTPLTDRWMDNPTIRFLKKFGGYWSDWNGFDVFAPFFFFRLIFGGLLVMSFWIA